eukprot:2538152-Pleurochrysis_carterae.AAC.5
MFWLSTADGLINQLTWFTHVSYRTLTLIYVDDQEIRAGLDELLWRPAVVGALSCWGWQRLL